MGAKIRRLKGSDRNDIIEISRHVWEGHDYLPSVADQWLQDPNSHFYGVEVHGHIVAVGNLEVIEDGRTGWMEGLRVHPDYRGRGFAKDITRCFVEKAELLGVKRLRYTTSTRNVASLKLAKMAGFTRILRMAVCWQFKPKPMPNCIDYPPIRKQSPKRTCSLLRTAPNIVPHGILTYDWKALDNTSKNVDEIGKTHTFCVALKNERVDSLSFGHLRQEPSRTWSFTTYANDSLGFLSQLYHNVAIAMNKGLSSVACTHETKFAKTLNEVDSESAEREETQLVLLEKQVGLRKRRSYGDTRIVRAAPMTVNT
jgi:N-acetylglutamate synthase-like GNAT family acetyltransferase